MTAKLPVENQFQNRQLSLFQQFLSNTDDEQQKLSNSIELWDSIPRYSVSRQAMTKMRDANGNLQLLKLDFEYRGAKINITIQAAQIEEKLPNGEVKTIAYYPSANEELVEEALRKLALDQGQGFYTKEEFKSGVVFSLYQLREELKKRGHTRSLTEIKLSLDILESSHIKITKQSGVKGKPIGSNYFPLVVGVTRTDLVIDPDAKWLVLFHPLVTESIDKMSYRQFNYQQLMNHTTQLARWLHKQLILKYTFASKLQPFEMRYSTIKRDSAMLNSYARERQAIEACDFAMNELVNQKIASQVTQKVITGERGKIVDVVYTIAPTLDFVGEVKAANARHAQLKNHQ